MEFVHRIGRGSAPIIHRLLLGYRLLTPLGAVFTCFRCDATPGSQIIRGGWGAAERGALRDQPRFADFGSVFEWQIVEEKKEVPLSVFHNPILKTGIGEAACVISWLLQQGDTALIFHKATGRTMHSRDAQHHREYSEMTLPDLADRVRQLRMEENLTQAQLAERTGYSISTISKAENYREGDGMIGARIFIIETLTEEAVEGPLYRTPGALEQ